MQALIVGADTLGNIPKLLAEYDINILKHVSGRNASHQRKTSALPKKADLMILFTDFLGHNVMKHYREIAYTQGVPVMVCRRSTTELQIQLSSAGLAKLTLH
ncbi:DUF2325 domain-containing protein [Leeia sp. TBRC 13508]|uniref:DUF2325 domain-containing protein n=1 Tax=Leeia speluncae TaxID=2884804 RepID=A0ABS8DA10_9NEIS|nr:DUF2325 domain-containing protein [Leeia speluncae]MCB6185039.1 DUF2325 domain-containing protein [Leeia speluncae]